MATPGPQSCWHPMLQENAILQQMQRNHDPLIGCLFAAMAHSRPNLPFAKAALSNCYVPGADPKAIMHLPCSGLCLGPCLGIALALAFPFALGMALCHCFAHGSALCLCCWLGSWDWRWHWCCKRLSSGHGLQWHIWSRGGGHGLQWHIWSTGAGHCSWALSGIMVLGVANTNALHAC